MDEKNVIIIPAKKKYGNTVSEYEVKKLRVAAYCRVSTDTDEQATSYEVQVKHYTDYITQNQTWEFAGVYADDGISGTGTRKRVEFLRLIDDCMAGKIDMVVTKSISRFARNTIDCLKYIRQLKERNIPVVFEKEKINTMDAKGEVFITIMASLAQQESESLSRNVRLGLQYRYQRGEVSVNTNWFLGYKKDEGGNLVIDPEQAETVKRIYREYLEGKSCRKIANGLMKDGILNGAGHRKWWDTNIMQILRNEKYMGDALLQKTFTRDVLTKKRIKNDGSVPQYYVEDSHEAIIPKDVFYEVQAEIARRSMLAAEKRGYSSKYALTGVIICKECGAAYRRVVWTEHGMKVPVWRCRNRIMKGGIMCLSPTIKEDDLHNLIVKAVQEAFGSEDDIKAEVERNIVSALSNGVEAYDEEIKRLQGELINRVTEGKDYADLAEKIKELRVKKKKAANDEGTQKEREDQIRELKEFLQNYDSSKLEYDDSLVKRLIKRIRVYRTSLKVEFKSGTEIEISM